MFPGTHPDFARSPAAAHVADTCIFLSDQEDWLTARADAARIRARDARKETPTVKSVYALMKGDTEIKHGPGIVYCELCGIPDKTPDQLDEEGILQDRCRGCKDNHCHKCLWTRPGTCGEQGVCAHCIIYLQSAGTAGVAEPHRDDSIVVAGACADASFMDYAKRINEIWDQAEELMAEAHPRSYGRSSGS